MGLLPPVGSGMPVDSRRISVLGINPPEEITPLASLIQCEDSRGIGLWRQDLYGVGEELASKRVKRGWLPGMEKDVFDGGILEDVVQQLVCWNPGTGNEWFARMNELPWYHSDDL